jgi:hypothetical protein
MMRRLGTVQKERVQENRGEILKYIVLERKVRGIVGTCNRKPQTLFLIYHRF